MPACNLDLARESNRRQGGALQIAGAKEGAK
jgi:hypothetical protein